MPVQLKRRLRGGQPWSINILPTLVDHWKLDAASGNETGAHASIVLTDNNTATSAAGKIGTARQLTAASSEYFSAADSAALSTGDIDFSLGVWVWPDTLSSNSTILSKWTETGNQREFLLVTSTTSVVWFLSAAGTTSSLALSLGAAPTLGAWNLIIATHDSVNNRATIEMNNSHFNAATHSSGVFNSTADFRIGAYQTTVVANFWNGRIDEVLFVKKVLTSAEKSRLWNAGAGLAYPYAT